MAIEPRRGCGYRKVGGLYLVSGGVWASCDRLPIEIGACPVCGHGLQFTRALTEINPFRLWGDHQDCRDTFICHACRPDDGVAYVMGVGERYYTPQNFITEGNMMGVCKRIPYIPKNMVLGQTWVYLSHHKLIYVGKENGKDVYKQGIFAAFRPERVEMLLWKRQATKKKLKELEKRGITPVIVPDGDTDHK